MKVRPDVIRVYLDESCDAVSYVVAGFIGAEENWKGFGDDWNAAMDKHGLKGVALHMREFEKSPKEPWASLRADQTRFEALRDDLIGVILAHGLAPFGAVALTDEYEALDAAGKKRWPNPYKLCFETAIFTTDDTCDPAPGGKIYLTFDQGSNQGWATQAYGRLRAKSTSTADHFEEKVQFGDRRTMPEICAADMIAYELRRAICNHITHGKNDLRPSFERLVKQMTVFWKVDFTNVIDPKSVVTFQGSKSAAADVPGQIFLHIDETERA